MKRKNISDFKPISNEPRGFTLKFWINDEKNKLVKFNNELYPDQDIMEKLSSDILKNIGVNVVDVELGMFGNDKCCMINSFLKKGDVLYEVDHNWSTRETGNIEEDIGMAFSKVIYKFSSLYDISKVELEKIKNDYIKMIFADCVIGNEDRKLKNVALIFNENSFKYRLAPCFDNALAFNAYRMIDTESIAYIGNQYFNSSDIINYLMKYYYEVIEQNIFDFECFIENSLVDLLNDYDELEYKKRSYIITEMKKKRNLLVNVKKKRG